MQIVLNMENVYRETHGKCVKQLNKCIENNQAVMFLEVLRTGTSVVINPKMDFYE